MNPNSHVGDDASTNDKRDKPAPYDPSKYSAFMLRSLAQDAVAARDYDQALLSLHELIFERSLCTGHDTDLLGQCYQRSLRFRDGIDVLTRVLHKFPNLAHDCFVELGLMYHGAEEREMAIEEYSRIIDSVEEEAVKSTNIHGFRMSDIFDFRAVARGGLLQHGKSISDYKKAIALAPNNLASRSGLAMSYATLGRRDLAEEVFRNAMVQDAKNRHRNRHLHASRGYMRLMWEEYESAISDFEVALKVDRKVGDRTGEALQLWRLAFAYLHLDDIDALSTARQFVELSHSVAPNFPTLPVAILRIPHLSIDFDDYLPLLGDSPATEALRRVLPTVDRMRDRFAFASGSQVMRKFHRSCVRVEFDCDCNADDVVEIGKGMSKKNGRRKSSPFLLVFLGALVEIL